MKVDVTEKLVILSNGCAWRNQWSWDFFLCVFGGSYHLQGVFLKKKIYDCWQQGGMVSKFLKYSISSHKRPYSNKCPPPNKPPPPHHSMKQALLLNKCPPSSSLLPPPSLSYIIEIQGKPVSFATLFIIFWASTAAESVQDKNFLTRPPPLPID